jgi:hypothetical protein
MPLIPVKIVYRFWEGTVFLTTGTAMPFRISRPPASAIGTLRPIV